MILTRKSDKAKRNNLREARALGDEAIALVRAAQNATAEVQDIGEFVVPQVYVIDNTLGLKIYSYSVQERPIGSFLPPNGFRNTVQERNGGIGGASHCGAQTSKPVIAVSLRRRL